ncbi:hypothetical protein BYT27DRAFT_7188160 [Phlegmacium glaucopus]|nr:hypothetical protein BYT27DRAFT_7188160 [Phlegmacium glaucopus]
MRSSFVIASLLSAAVCVVNAAPTQSVSEIKLQRLTEHNQRLRDDLNRPRVRVSEASATLIHHCQRTEDHLVPSVWGPAKKGEDPYAHPVTGHHCVVM